ncbi:MAG: beta-1,3-glucanase family protein [Propionibacterium sp.]
MTSKRSTTRRNVIVLAAIVAVALIAWLVVANLFRARTPGSSASPAGSATSGASSAGPVDPSSLRIDFANNTGSDTPLYVYIVGTSTTITTGDKLGYVDGSGHFQLWPTTGGTTPVDAPDVAIQGPASGSSMTLHLPVGMSGRIYYALGHKLSFGLVGAGDGTTGLIQPAPWDSGDKNYGTLFDWTEFTFTGGSASGTGLWANPTQVDQLAVPATVGVTGPDNASSSTGTLLAGGRKQVVDALQADPAWAKSVVRDSSGNLLRVLAPGHATAAGLLAKDYLDEYISKAWSAYTSTALTVVPSEQQPDRKFSGRTSGDVMSFTDSSGATVASFAKPSSADVWGCDGNLNGVGNATLPNDQTIGPISRTLCAALTRGTLGTADTEPVTDAAKFFTNSSGLNLYAKSVHAVMKDGRAYAFPFDDVGAHESLVSQSNPSAMSIALQPLT